MNVILLDPKGNQVGYNTGFAYIASSLLKAGHKVKVIDFNHFHDDINKRMQEVKNADLVGITFKSFTIDAGVKLAQITKKINPNVKLIAGGPHLTVDCLGFMEKYDIFDMAAMGDSEEIMVDICSNKKITSINGLIYRNKKGELKINKPREKLLDLDKLPFPEYRVFDTISKYKIPFPYNYYPLVTSRGCPCDCLYCSVPMISGRRWRYRSPENMIEELKQMKKIYKLKEFGIYDDNFTVNINRAKKFCRLLIEEKLNLKWSCGNGIRAKSTDFELAKLMKKSGCFHVNFGIEHGHPRMFKSIGKGGSLKDIRIAIKNFKKAGIRVGGFFLIGLPDSNKKLDNLNIKLSQTFNLDQIFWSYLSPYPGTRLYEMVYDQKGKFKVINDWRKSLSCGHDILPVYVTKDYSAKERLDTYFKANIKTRCYGNVINMNYSNTQKALTLIKMIIKYDFFRIFHHAFWLFKGVIVGIKNKTVRISL